ncbi:MAG: hypothetical protein EB127_02160 [Alphaproteobacteria bacterium]|nr:hypothetical protein [Alphaproteobacteria bacterium]
MEWRENQDEPFVSIANCPLYYKKLNKLELRINNKIIEILVPGKFSLKKRKVVLHGILRNSYKVSISEIPDSITFLGISNDPFFIKVYPLIKTSGLLFTNVSKKILVNKRQSKVDLLLDNNGKIIS